MDDLVTRLRARRGAERSLDPWGPDPDCAEAADEIVRLRTALAEAEAERNAWRKAMQSWTPGGSEFTTPEACSSFVAMRRESEHEAKCAKVRAMRALADAEAERDGLAAALLPFAEHAEHVEVWCLTNTANVHVVTENGTGAVLSRVTLGDFRRARAALTRPAVQPEGEHD